MAIDANNAGQRIDNFLLALCKHKVPKSLIYRKLRKGEVRVNKKRIGPSYKLQLNDMVRIPPIQIYDQDDHEPKPLPQHWIDKLSQAVLYEDDEVIVINKPIGLAVHGGTGVNVGLIEISRAMRPECKFLELAHRLDRDTSGCILLAKKRQALLHMHEQLREKTMRKCYHAVVIGTWPKNINKVTAPLKKNTLQSGERMVKVDKIEGKEAVTTFQILKKAKDVTLVAAFPQTGRTHQSRVHAQAAGCAILGDSKYAPKDKSKALLKQYGIKRLCLHAYQLTFQLPGGEDVTVTSEYDKEFAAIIRQIL